MNASKLGQVGLHFHTNHIQYVLVYSRVRKGINNMLITYQLLNIVYRSYFCHVIVAISQYSVLCDNVNITLLCLLPLSLQQIWFDRISECDLKVNCKCGMMPFIWLKGRSFFAFLSWCPGSSRHTAASHIHIVYVASAIVAGLPNVKG